MPTVVMRSIRRGYHGHKECLEAIPCTIMSIVAVDLVADVAHLDALS